METSGLPGPFLILGRIFESVVSVGSWKNGVILGGQRSPPNSKMEIPAPLRHIRPSSPVYCVEKIWVLCEGDPATGQPFTPHRFFRKLGATAFPNPLSENFEKSSGRGDWRYAQVDGISSSNL